MSPKPFPSSRWEITVWAKVVVLTTESQKGEPAGKRKWDWTRTIQEKEVKRLQFPWRGRKLESNGRI